MRDLSELQAMRDIVREGKHVDLPLAEALIEHIDEMEAAIQAYIEARALPATQDKHDTKWKAWHARESAIETATYRLQAFLPGPAKRCADA